MKQCPKCKKIAVKSALTGKDRLMRTWCTNCGHIIEQEGYGGENKNV